jgi:predicted alpha/beta-hydrolase family hydrolase
MYSFRTLEIKGFGDQSVPNTFLWQESEARQVAVILPGIGYTCHMPLLYYPSKVLLALGMDVMWVDYNYIRQPGFRMLSDDEQNRRILEDVSAACQAAVAQRSYRDVAIIGKSLGTRAMAQLIASDATFAQCRDVWLTPVLRDDRVREQIRSRQSPLVVVGTADSYYDAAYFAGLRVNPPGEVMIVNGADHSMEIENDFEQSLSILEKVTRGIRGFLSFSQVE